jgi:hypothetical protein
MLGGERKTVNRMRGRRFETGTATGNIAAIQIWERQKVFWRFEAAEQQHDDPGA